MLFLCSLRDSSWVPIDGETALNHDLPMIHYMENGAKHGTFRSLFNQDEANLLAAFSKEEIQNIYSFNDYRKKLVVSKYREGHGWEEFFPLQFSVETLDITTQRGEKSYNLEMDRGFKIECYLGNTAGWHGRLGLLDFFNGNVFERCQPLAAYRLRFGDSNYKNCLVINPNYRVR